jgi:DNA primase
MKTVTATRIRYSFRRDLLPDPADYYLTQGLKLTGRGTWQSALCPFHHDTHPSLRVHLATGRFRCMVCGIYGRDVLAFHMQRYGVGFTGAAKALGAWGMTQ